MHQSVSYNGQFAVHYIEFFFTHEDCPGTKSEDAGKATACQGCPNQAICSAGIPKAPDPGAD